MTILDDLKLEHDLVGRGLMKLISFWLKLEKNTDVALLNELQDFFKAYTDFVGGLHHEKEELFLFPALGECADLREGGPKCVFFMSFYVANNPLDSAKKRIAEYNLKTESITHRENIEKLIAMNSPLSILISEHDAGHLLTAAISEMFTKCKQDFEANKWALIFLLSDYMTLIELHQRKEDECLFLVCEKLLPQAKLMELGTEALELNKKFPGVKERLAELLK